MLPNAKAENDPSMNATKINRTQGAWHRVFQNPATSIGLAILCLALDFFIGPYIIFPVTFIVPVIISAWFCRPGYAYALAVLQPLIRLSFAAGWQLPWGATVSIINTAIRIVVLGFFAYLVSRTARQTRELAKRVNLLEGILPICSLCKKIRDEQGNWQHVEIYVSNRSEALFSHSLCPDCLQRDYRHVQSETPVS
jgi:hypothetical protein